MDKQIVLPSPELLSKITETEPQVALIPEGDHVAAAIKLHGYDDMYLYVARLLDPRVVAAIARDAGERRRIRQSRSAPARHSDRLRADVRASSR